MSDIKEILNSILSDEKLLSSKAFRDKVYSDTPLLRPASQLKRPETPAKLKEMKAIAYTPEAYWKTSAWLFVKQGQFMADYEDSYPLPEDFAQPYPTYREMTMEQLRGYFSWRNDIRKGRFSPAPLPFVMMYAFELINLIGVESPEAGFTALGQLREMFPDNEELCRKLQLWQKDMVIRYELPTELIADFPETIHDRLLLDMINWEKVSDKVLFDSAAELSQYRMESSRFFQEQPELFMKGFCAAYRALAQFYRDKRKNSLFEKLFGKMADSVYHLFEGAVYFEQEPTATTACALSDIQVYTCEFGRWSALRFHNRGRCKALGEVFRQVDNLLRELTGYRYRINPGEVGKNTTAMLKKALEPVVKKETAPEPVKIEFDLSKLDAIRAASEATCEKLLVDEEELPELTAAVPEEPEREEEPAQEMPIDAGEAGFLRALLEGGDWQSAAKNCGSMPSIIAESINEKLFDDFGDTVIGFDGDVPFIIEDYADELRDMLGRGKA